MGYDAQNDTSAKNLSILIGDKAQAEVVYDKKRPQVEQRFLGIDRTDDHDFKIGFTAKIQKNQLPAGCHELFFKFVRNESAPLITPTKIKLCIEK
jgi:hypothetical protein